jgi:diguanylate cyclase (GGDEF)-like protein
MKTAFSLSKHLLIATVLMLVMNIVNAGFVLDEINRLRYDAGIINNAGIIRGAIQRSVKMELAGQRADAVIEQTDRIISSFVQKEKGFELKKYEDQFHVQLKLLGLSWIGLKGGIYRYRQDRGDRAREELFRQSEKCWNLSNQLVYLSQYAAESKLGFFRVIFIIISINIIAVLVIIELVRSYVRDRLEFVANFDSLTGAMNRHSFNIIFVKETNRSRRYRSPLSLIIFDIDHFKKVNDSRGHKAGDAVLKELSGVVASQVRRSDFFCRIGGEEFVVVAVETSLENAKGLSEKLRRSVEEFRFREAGKVTISVGVAQFNGEESSGDLFRRADEALYRAKERGRNRVEMAG